MTFFSRAQNLFLLMSKKFLNFLYCFFSRVQFLIMSQKKWQKFLMIFVFFSPKNGKNFLKIIPWFSLSSLTISPYFNSSYYSFFTFLTLYPISFNISQKKIFSWDPMGGLTPQKLPLPTPLCVTKDGSYSAAQFFGPRLIYETKGRSYSRSKVSWVKFWWD